MKSRRTKACSIKPKVREAVERRDSIDGVPACVFCKTTRDVRGEAHYIRRSQGGLGIEQNLLTVCRTCHRKFDEGEEKSKMRKEAADYLRSLYPGWNEVDLVYRKGMEL